jgi:hypothetical protein
MQDPAPASRGAAAAASWLRSSLRWANTIGVDARVIPLDPPGDAEAGATEHHLPAIAFTKSDRLAAPVAGDAYGDEAAACLSR